MTSTQARITARAARPASGQRVWPAYDWRGARGVPPRRPPRSGRGVWLVSLPCDADDACHDQTELAPVVGRKVRRTLSLPCLCHPAWQPGQLEAAAEGGAGMPSVQAAGSSCSAGTVAALGATHERKGTHGRAHRSAGASAGVVGADHRAVQPPDRPHGHHRRGQRPLHPVPRHPVQRGHRHRLRRPSQRTRRCVLPVRAVAAAAGVPARCLQLPDREQRRHGPPQRGGRAGRQGGDGRVRPVGGRQRWCGRGDRAGPP